MSPVMEARKGSPEFLCTSAMGEFPKTGAVPVDVSIGEDDPMFIIQH